MTLSSTPEFDNPEDELRWVLSERFEGRAITGSTVAEITATVHAWADRHFPVEIPPFEVVPDGPNGFAIVKKTGD